MEKETMAVRPAIAATYSHSTPPDSAELRDDDVNTGTKIETVLRLFVRGESLNRFEAEAHHDHCLHSTVSTLEDYGIRIARQWEVVPCLRGLKAVHVKRYWLDPDPLNLAAAHRLLKAWERT